MAGGSKSEAGNRGARNKNVYLRDVECGTMFHNSRIEYMTVYPIHEATGLRRL